MRYGFGAMWLLFSSFSRSFIVNKSFDSKYQSSLLFSTKTSRQTGGLRRLVVVKPPNELISRALKMARRINADKTMKNAKLRAKKHGAETLNECSQNLCRPLKEIQLNYRLRNFHAFERVVADLTIRARQQKDGLTLSILLEDIHEARKMILAAGKEYIYKVKEAPTAREASAAMEEGLEGMSRLFQEFAGPPVTGICDLQRSLRSAPVVALDTPAVVLVGAPNVGKSSIVRAISSATPEVNNYPFTTRGMTLGHVELFWKTSGELAQFSSVPTAKRKLNQPSPQVVTGDYAVSHLCQVMDSPGLLVREEDQDRNEMEALTLAAMEHLPTAVLYVMDLSGGAGDRCSSIQDQLTLRKMVRARFPKRPWLDVVTKVDLGVDADARKELDEILQGAPCLELSIHEDIGVDELKSHVVEMLGQVKVVLDAMSASKR